MDLIMFTHTDMDGYGCKMVMDITMKIIGNTEYMVIPCHNPNESLTNAVNEVLCDVAESDMLKDTWIVFTDICPSEDLLINTLLPLLNNNHIKQIKVYDHHKSNLFAKDLLPDDACDIIPTDDMKMDNPCGTSLLYQACMGYLRYIPNEKPHLVFDERLYAQVVETIRLWDTYEWKHTNDVTAKKLQMMFSMIGGENFVNKYVNRILSCSSTAELFTEAELEFIDSKYEYTQDVINRLTVNDFITTTVRGYKVALLIKGVAANISDVSDHFLELFPEYDAVAQLSTFGNWSFSFRSRKQEIDSAELFAIPVGGGGHPKASGASVPQFIKDLITDVVTRYLNGDEFNVQVSTTYSSHNYDDDIND